MTLPFRRSMILFVLSLAVCLGLMARPLPAAHAVTLESVLSAPYPTELIASPRGDILAWAFDEQGKKNVWVAQGPDFKARPLTHFDLDDGQEISGLVFSFDGSTVVFVRGQGPNNAGESPNPTSNPQGAEQAVWAVKVGDGKPWRIGPGSGPVASPSENLVVYSVRGSLYSASLAAEAAPQPLFKARGSADTYSFSANGQWLAFSSERGDHSLIGIYDLMAKTVVWVSPSVDRDVYPAFSRDSKHLAFVRFPGGRAEELELAGGFPFLIMVADAATGEARAMWTSPNPTGGFAQTYFNPPWTWAADGRIVFYSEHEGWMHLYALDTSTGKVTNLTPGEFEVEDSCLSADGKTLFFNSNQGDVDRRHLWAVSVSGGTPRALTQGPSLEWRPEALAGGKLLAFLGSTGVRPAAPAIMSLDGQNRRLIAPELIPASFPSAELVEPQQVIFKSPDGLNIHGQLFLPKGAKSGDHRPAAIFMHGGPIRQMLLGFHYYYYYHNSYAFNQFLASKGYVVLSVNYRLGIGYGRPFREAAKGGYKGASEYQDIVAAGTYLRNRPDVDPNRIGLWGGSYGGYLTAMGLARNSDLFAAGVDFHGVHDWSAYFRAYGNLLEGAKAEELRRVAVASSPVASVDSWSSPVLFIHGDDDRNVAFSQTTDLIQKLRAIGHVHLEILVFPDEVHDFLRHADWLKAYHAAYDFFERMMK